jgi:endonuclease/exonuclease/phosphatase family metal-dependent hydrolase
MSQIKLPILKNLMILLNIGVIVCYLLTILLPYVNTEILWFIAIIGLGFPLILFALICFIILWIIFRSKWWLISFIVLLAGYQQIFAVLAFNSPKKFSLNKTPETIRVLHWNVSNWDKRDYQNENSYREKMLELVKDQKADVLCFQEFYESKSKKPGRSTILAFQKMGYPNYYFIPSNEFTSGYLSGIAIFSKYPMTNSTNYAFSEDKIGEHLIQTDINIEGKIVRLMTTHLQSVRFNGSDYDNFNLLKKGQNPKLRGSRTLVSKLKRGYQSRYEQAKLVNLKINESPYPVIITGDFNDVPNSSTYFKIRGDLQDAFLEKGSFIGRTFRFLSPTLRIDYILADPSFKVTQFKRLTVPYSDHFGLVTDLAF